MPLVQRGQRHSSSVGAEEYALIVRMDRSDRSRRALALRRNVIALSLISMAFTIATAVVRSDGGCDDRPPGGSGRAERAVAQRFSDLLRVAR